MKKKVRFNDEVQINHMTINLSDHIKEVKLAKDIILDPNKTLPSKVGHPIDTEPLIPAQDINIPPEDRILGIPVGNATNFWFWILVGIILIVILAIFSATDAGKRILIGKGSIE